ncbi:sulfite exporter TauE/SafE family protein [Saccharibacillus alkalitolerans]|uniref:Probable membrane transporter protein n=1 Tax=Saccharibacillus alkalitolerans TaxID=2705290 RepID=A0ABX0FCE4_9BACL|nr:sulfite exporter TauE/SafE family protein [Saccharibacillus alkalitolerans]NGZ77749.1 sulfite exporter TauE/SafE family protein [Saccharibacillus alkalitolerans]
MEIILLISVGMLASVCGAAAGLGGGFIIVPVLALLYVIPVSDISGTSMAVLFVSAISSTIAYARQKRIDYRSGLSFAVAMIPGSILGAWTTGIVGNRVFFVSLGIFLVLMAISINFKPTESRSGFLKPNASRSLLDASGIRHEYSFNMTFAAGVAFFVGFLSSLFGIGGGSVMVPTMILFLAFPPHIATATSMFSILVSAFVGTLSHALLGHVMWDKFIWLALGALAGGQIGARIASKIPAIAVVRVLSVCLLIAAVRLMFKG